MDGTLFLCLRKALKDQENLGPLPKALYSALGPFCFIQLSHGYSEGLLSWIFPGYDLIDSFWQEAAASDMKASSPPFAVKPGELRRVTHLPSATLRNNTPSTRNSERL